MQKEQIDQLVGKNSADYNQEFVDTRMVLEEGVKYAARIMGNSTQAFNGTKNLVIMAAPFKDGTKVEDYDFAPATIGQRAFVGAGIRTKQEKFAASQDKDKYFIVSWNYLTNEKGKPVFRTNNDGEDYQPKVFEAMAFKEKLEVK